MDVRVGDILVMKKNHPVVATVFGAALRYGFKIRCESCGREVMVPRSKAERALRAFSARRMRKQK